MKVQEIAAEVGGLFKFLSIIGTFFMYPISNKLINLDLMNEIFHFQPYSIELEKENKSSLSNHKVPLENKKELIIKNNYSPNKIGIQERKFRNEIDENDKNLILNNNKEINKVKVNDSNIIFNKTNYSNFVISSNFPITNNHNIVSKVKHINNIKSDFFNTNNDKENKTEKCNVIIDVNKNVSYLIDNNYSAENSKCINVIYYSYFKQNKIIIWKKN